jgi:ABC-type Zn2+ transport system substrate-binding protein/surface adhesin
MEFFKRIFAKPAEKPIAGDAKVASAILQSVKAGADCKTQVLAVQKMLGDRADATLKGYFEELTGDEVSKAPKEKIAEAIDIVDAAVQKAFGDAEEEPQQKSEEKSDEKKSEDKKSEDKADEKKSEEPSTGDAMFTKADVEKMVGDAVAKAFADKQSAEQKAADEEESSFEQSRLDALMTGDAQGEKSHTSDALLKEIWG